MTKLQFMHSIINESKIIHALSTNLMHSLAQITRGSIHLNIFFTMDGIPHHYDLDDVKSFQVLIRVPR